MNNNDMEYLVKTALFMGLVIALMLLALTGKYL